MQVVVPGVSLWIVCLLAALTVPLAPPSGSPYAPIAPSSSPIFNGNFSISAPGPGTSLPPVTLLTIQYEIMDPTYTSALSGLAIRIPAPVASFNTTAGTVRVYLPAKVITLVAPGWTNVTNTSTSMLLLNATTFSSGGPAASHRAIFSSQTVAVTSPSPYGSLSLALRWRWILQPSVGANITGPWLPPNGTVIVPDQFADLASTSSKSLSPGDVFTACLDGPIGGRTFSLHAVQPDPRADLFSVNATAPLFVSGPFCIQLRVPNYIAPQLLLFLVWDYSNAAAGPANTTTFLLYIVRVTVVAPPAPPWVIFGVPGWTFLGVAAGVAGGSTVAIALAMVYSRRRRRRRLRSMGIL